ncbi:hypothetical protein [Methanoregula sp.]|jgi:hypothetical protein|uniref:hypothetical protein n=1 Tax=Methanoregula sp. TaxID=2052170 RepID=UPI003C1E5BDE
MESLESKLDRLSPEQRREVEDFVDFLIQRAEGIRVTIQLASHDASPSLKSVAPPLISPDLVPSDDGTVPPSRDGINSSPASQPIHESEPSVLVHEIAGTDGDTTPDGYFEYGKFEKSTTPAPITPSPADMAVQKVKRKLIQKSEQVSKDKLLDWID